MLTSIFHLSISVFPIPLLIYSLFHLHTLSLYLTPIVSAPLCLSSNIYVDFHYEPSTVRVHPPYPTLVVPLPPPFSLFSHSSEGFPVSSLIYLEMKFLIDSAFRRTNLRTVPSY